MSLLKTFKDKLGNIIYPATHAKAVFVEKDGIAVDLQTAIDNGDIGGSGGHTIVNSSGSSMTIRSKLKFANATVTDDSTNDQTVITTNPASAVQTATLNDVNFIKDSQDSGVYYITRSGFCEVHIKTIVAKNAGQGLLVAAGLPRSAYEGIIMGNTPYFEDGTAFYINTTNNITSLYALIPDTGVKSGYVLYMMR